MNRLMNDSRKFKILLFKISIIVVSVIVLVMSIVGAYYFKNFLFIFKLSQGEIAEGVYYEQHDTIKRLRFP